MAEECVFAQADYLVRTTTGRNARAAIERWLVNYVSVNPNFTVEQATAIAVALATRWGGEYIASVQCPNQLLHMEVRTALDWTIRGSQPYGEADPIKLPGAHGIMLEAYPACDVTEPDWAGDSHTLVGTAYLPEAPLHSRTMNVFDELLPERSLAYFSQLTALNFELRRVHDPNADFLVSISAGQGDRVAGSPWCLLDINTAVDGNLTFNILRALAQLFYAGILENSRDIEADEHTIHPLELSLIAYVVGVRLHLVSAEEIEEEDHWIEDFFHVLAGNPVDVFVDWAVIGKAAGALEDALNGHSYLPSLGD